MLRFFNAILLGLPLHWVQARDGMTIDKLECIGFPPTCTDMYCNYNIAPDNPFDTNLSFGCNFTRLCSAVSVRLTNYVKVKKGPFKPFGFKLTLDICSIAAGGQHPIIKTFMGPDFYEQFDKFLHPCPYGPEIISVRNFSIDGKERGMFGMKRVGLYRTDFEFTCGQNLPLFTLKVSGKRSLYINETGVN